MGPAGVEGPPGVAPAADDAPGASTPLDGDRGDGAGPLDEERSSRRRRLRWLVAGALAVVVVAVLAVVLLGSGSGGHHGAETGVPAGEETASVTRRTLSESSTVDGTLGYGTTLELFDRLGGTFTWLPSVGTVIGRGGTLWRIDDLPVVLMYGSVPAYRTLEQGVSDGPDVTELNENLINLGFDPYGAIVDDESFGAATAAAVKRWQQAEGLPETGEVELGRVVFAGGARRVTDVKVTLGQDPPGAMTPTETTPSGTTPTAMTPATTPVATTPAASNPGAGKSPSKTPGSKSPGKGKGSPNKGKEEPAKGKPVKDTPAKEEPAKEKPAKQDPAKDNPGKESPSGEAGAGAGEVVLTTTSTQQIVQLKVKPEQQQLARLGETVTVLLPGGGQAPGHVTEVGTVASESKGSGSEEKGSPGGESGESTIPVTITLDHDVAHLDEAPVSVELVKSVRRNVLTVPATALIATAGGGYAAETLEQDRRVTVPVTPGMFAGGYVQVEGAGVREGMTVIESQ
jgi:peptidoglycan hydrolase-like protein with peptidoglycan-binding domain